MQTVKADYLNVPDNITREIYLGAKQIQTIVAPFQSTTNGNLALNYSMPSRTIVGNDWGLQGSLMLQVNCAANSGLDETKGMFSQIYGSTFAARNHFLNWMMENVNIKINNVVSTTQVKRLMPSYSKCMSNSDALEYSGKCPCLPDQGFYAYADAVGTSQNVLSSMTDNREDWMPNGTWPSVEFYTAPTVLGDPLPIAAGCTGYIKFTFENVPLLATPLANPAVGVAKTYISNIDTIDINIVTDGKYDLCFSSANPAITVGVGAITNVWGNASNGLFLLMQSYIPQDYMPLPKEVKLLNVLYDIKSETLQSGGGSTNIFQFDNYCDSFIFYLTAKQSNNLTTTDASSFIKISQGFSLNINGDNSIWNGYKDSQVFDIVKKYSRVSYAEFSGVTNKFINNATGVVGGVLQKVKTSGPVYVAKSGVDIPISNSSVVAGMPYRIQLQFQNLKYDTTLFPGITPELTVIGVRLGEIVLSSSSGMQTSTTVSLADVPKAINDAAPAFESEVHAEGGRRRHRKLVMGNVGRGSAPSAGARSAGRISVNGAIPNVHSSRF